MYCYNCLKCVLFSKTPHNLKDHLETNTISIIVRPLFKFPFKQVLHQFLPRDMDHPTIKTAFCPAPEFVLMVWFHCNLHSVYKYNVPILIHVIKSSRNEWCFLTRERSKLFVINLAWKSPANHFIFSDPLFHWKL